MKINKLKKKASLLLFLWTRFLIEKRVLLRRLVLLFGDYLCIYLSLLLTTLALKGLNYEYSQILFVAFIILPLAGPIYIYSGQYKGLSRYVESQSIYKLFLRQFFIVFITFLFFELFNTASGLPFIWWINFLFFLSVLNLFLKLLLRDLLLHYGAQPSNEIKNVVIYGAGSAGAQLSATLRLSNKHSIKFFVDDDNSLWGRNISDIKIYPPEKISQISDQFDQILLAIPSLKKEKRRKIISYLKKFKKPILQVPSVEEITSGKTKIDILRSIEIEDLLDRKSVPAKDNLLGPGINNNVICITGAGGSIGSELARQVIKLKPKKIILFEKSEPSLYLIHRELLDSINQKVEIIPVLGDCVDFLLVKEVFFKYDVKIAFHAAAYKHVPLVELNPLQGIKNNILSARNVCKAANQTKITNLILISTDKAVRPTSIMGVSKRISELIFQSFASSESNGTIYSMVRFGNVLASSGSVVPLFKKQIETGGPITLTHPDITRYFMTIPEAVELVIQTSVLAEGGEVFILDMGKPVKIINLAKQMIMLSGLSVKDEENPNGDIEIEIVGLRPGEKLFEELLLENNSEKTQHPLIFKAKEKSLEFHQLSDDIEKLNFYLTKRDLKESIKILRKLVPEWKYIDRDINNI